MLALALHVVFFATLGGQGRPRRKAGFTVTLVKTPPISEPLEVSPLKSPSPRAQGGTHIRCIKRLVKCKVLTRALFMLVNTSSGKQALVSSTHRGRIPLCEEETRGQERAWAGVGCSGLPYSSRDKRPLAPCGHSRQWSHSCQGLAGVGLAGSQGGLAPSLPGAPPSPPHPLSCSDLLSFVLVIANPQRSQRHHLYQNQKNQVRFPAADPAGSLRPTLARFLGGFKAPGRSLPKEAAHSIHSFIQQKLT